MPFSTNVIRLLEEIEPSPRKVLIAILEEIERQREKSVTRKEFLEFARQTDENFKKVWKAISELAEAQKRSEQRITRLEKVVEELAEAQKRTEARVEELAEAQKRTEARVEELAEAQKRTEAKVEELAEAQKRTEEELRKLVGEHRKTRENLGGLQHTVGYVLEDRAYAGLPPLLEKEAGIKITTPLRRDYIEVKAGRYEEVNLIGKGKIGNKEVWIVGECKSQLKKSDVDTFLKHLKRIEEVLSGDKVPVMVTYQTPPPVREYIKSKGIRLYFSYQMPL